MKQSEVRSQQPVKIRHFTDLIVWQKGHNLVITIYELTGSFPDVEKFSLTDQMRRSAISITSNLAEGFGRRSTKERARFYWIAFGSLTELQNQLLIARDVGYIAHPEASDLALKVVEVRKLLGDLIRSLP